MFAVPAVEDCDEREETDAHNRIEGDEPGGRQRFAHKDEIELPVAPDEVAVENLVVRNQGDSHDRDEKDQREYGRPHAFGQLPLGRILYGGETRVVVARPQIFLAPQINADGEKHTDAGGGEAVVPPDLFAKRSDDERRQDHAGIDTEIENLKGIGAPEIFRFVKRTDLAGDVPLEHSDPDHEAEKREQERRLECHQKMARRHGERAEQNGAAASEETIGEEAAEDRGEINESRVGAEDRRGERLTIQTQIKPAETGERRDMLDASRQEKILHHVKDEERLHPVIGETFPGFGEGKEPEPARMAEETGGVLFAGQRGGVLWFGGGGHAGMVK